MQAVIITSRDIHSRLENKFSTWQLRDLFVDVFILKRGYAKRWNDYCCESEYANLSLTQM